MKKSDRAFVLCAVFVLLTAVFYCATVLFPIPLPRYFPLEHVWRWSSIKGVPSQGWYGMQAFAFLAAGIGTGILYVVLRRVCPPEAELSPRAAKALGLVTVLVVLLAMAYLLNHEFTKWHVW